jgi:outer membrane protein OmpA-like peptidoglycan-associated protein
LGPEDIEAIEEVLALKYGKKSVFTLLLIAAFAFSLFGLIPKDDIATAPGARAAGMGGAFAAIADDFSSYYYNPAGLVLINRANLSVCFDSVFKGSQSDPGIVYVQPLQDDSSFGLAYYKDTYASSKFSDDMFYISYAAYLDEKKTYSLGANLKHLSTSASGYNAYGKAGSMDIGVMVFPDILEKKIRFGFLAQDMDAVMIWNNGLRQRIPLLFKMGTSYSFDKTAVVDMDVDIIQSDAGRDHSRTGVHMGGEKWFLNKDIGNFGVRGGFYWREAVQQNAKYGFGVSYGREDFVVDYVFIPDWENFGDTHKINISWFIAGMDRHTVKSEEKSPGVIAEKTEANAPAPAATASERFKYMEPVLSQKYLSTARGSLYGHVDITLSGRPVDMTGLDWVFDIVDPKGMVIKETKGNGTVPDIFSWAGDDNSGAAVKDGDYIARITINKDGSMIWQKVKVVTVDATPPSFSAELDPKVFAPVKGSRVNELSVAIKTDFSDIKAWTLSIKDSSGGVIRKMSGDGFTDKLSWGGKDALGAAVKDGSYQAEISMEDYAGNSYTAAESFKVDTYISKFTVNINTKIFKPGKENVEIGPNFVEPGKIKSWDLQITDKNNKAVRSFDNRPLKAKSAVWDGTDENNVTVRAGSVYKYRLVIHQKNGITNYAEGLIETDLPEFKDAGIQLTLAAIDFEAGDKTIPAGAYLSLDQACEAVKKYAKDYYLYIKAAANDTGTADENMKLSMDRALAVKDYLVTTRGLNEDNIYIIGYGDGEYADRAVKDKVLKAGKRVEVELLTK